MRWSAGAAKRKVPHPMKISFDLRFAHRSGGAAVYTARLLGALVHLYPDEQWQIYHNPASQPQQQILQSLARLSRTSQSPLDLQLRPIRSGCLSLSQHAEFYFIRDDACLYHYPHFDLPLGLRNIPLVMTIHDLYPLTIPRYCSPAKRAYFKFVARRNAQRAARIITISQYSKNDIIEHLGIPQNKITVIPQGYAPDFCPLNDNALLDKISRKYHLPQKFILYTGNHKPHKNLHRLLHAFAQLPKPLQQTYPLVLTGPTTAETQELRRCAAQLDIDRQVTFIGLVPAQDLPALYNLASLAVQPSLYEGFGFGPLEAMACGAAVACAHAAAIPEVVGDVARFFDPYSVDDIAHALADALKNDTENPTLRDAGLKRAALFTMDRTAHATFKVYQEVARPAPSS